MEQVPGNLEPKLPRLFVVVLNWNGIEDLLECLDSVKKSTYKNEIIVVDNGSTDDSVAILATQFPDVMIIETGKNLGFGANNLGISQALRYGADYVFLLNNDTWVDPKCFQQLIQVAEKQLEVGILSPRICHYSDPEVIWYDGGKLERINGFWKQRHINEESLVKSVGGEICEVDYVCGCAMLIRRRVIEKIGGLDAHFFMYWEDVDYSLRARRSGFQLLQVPSALVLHKISQSIGGSENPDAYYYMQRNCYFVSSKGVRVLNRLAMLNRNIHNCFWQYCALMENGKIDHACAVAHAAWDCLIGRGGKRRGKVPRLILESLEKRRFQGKQLNQMS